MTASAQAAQHESGTNGIARPVGVASRADSLLGAIAESARELLRSGSAVRSFLPVLEIIGRATNVERVHLVAFEQNETQPGLRILDHQVWTAPGASVPAEFMGEEVAATAPHDLRSWMPRLARGETISGSTRSFKGPVRAFFERGAVLSTLAVPVFVEQKYWGVIGFDACRSEREWLPGEIDALRILAELIGATLTRGRRQQRLADANQIIENSPTVLYRFDAREPFPLIFLSQNIRQFGYEADELLASPGDWSKLIEPADLTTALANMRALVAGRDGRDRLDFRFKRSDGSMVWLAGEATALRDSAGRVVAVEGILTDISEQKRTVEKFAALARTDSLTGLPNRAAFLERLQLAFARARRGANAFAVHYLDLDHFKDVNDTLGHPAGDSLLQAVAERLKHCVREIDLVARFGGDEFAVLQEDLTDFEGVEALAAKIGTAISSPFTIGGNQVHSTASIGIVLYETNIQDPEAMLAKADLALYRAKGEGRNQFQFHIAELDQEAQDRMTLGRDLHQAIERKEFELFYQPQVELASGRIVGLEALIRWNHPTRGLLLPSVFIPIAETNGTIMAIGRWVVEEACRQMSLWQQQGIAPPIMAVNISAAQFQSAGDLEGIIGATLAKYDMASDALELELTESVLMATTQRHAEALTELRRIGVRLSIDDFGTGFSSLSYLSSFRVARLKLAIEFIRDVTTNSDNAAIVRATVGLAHALGIGVIAEGVNSPEQRAFLMAAGCRYAQGFQLGAPMPASFLGKSLRQNLLSAGQEHR